MEHTAGGFPPTDGLIYPAALAAITPLLPEEIVVTVRYPPRNEWVFICHNLEVARIIRQRYNDPSQPPTYVAFPNNVVYINGVRTQNFQPVPSPRSLPLEFRSCLFCAKHVPPNCNLNTEWKFDINVPNPSYDTLMQGQYKSLFIVRALLQIPKPKARDYHINYLQHLNPDYWVIVCQECDQDVHKFYQIWKEKPTFKGEVEMFQLWREFKQKMLKTNKAPNVRPLWKWIREAVPKDYPFNPRFYTAPCFNFNAELLRNKYPSLEQALNLDVDDPLLGEYSSTTFGTGPGTAENPERDLAIVGHGSGYRPPVIEIDSSTDLDSDTSSNESVTICSEVGSPNMIDLVSDEEDIPTVNVVSSNINFDDSVQDTENSLTSSPKSLAESRFILEQAEVDAATAVIANLNDSGSFPPTGVCTDEKVTPVPTIIELSSDEETSDRDKNDIASGPAFHKDFERATTSGQSARVFIDICSDGEDKDPCNSSKQMKSSNDHHNVLCFHPDNENNGTQGHVAMTPTTLPTQRNERTLESLYAMWDEAEEMRHLPFVRDATEEEIAADIEWISRMSKIQKPFLHFSKTKIPIAESNSNESDKQGKNLNTLGANVIVESPANVSERAEGPGFQNEVIETPPTTSSSGLEQSLKETEIRDETVASEIQENAENIETAGNNFGVTEPNSVDEAISNDDNNDESNEDTSRPPERQTRFGKRKHAQINEDSNGLQSETTTKSSTFPKKVAKNGTNSKPRIQEPPSKPASTIKKKRFECGECKKAFKDNYHLTRHVNGVHRGLSQEKNFECDVCGAAFRDRNGLKRHQLVHDKSRERLACRYCKTTFGRQEHLERHQIELHYSSLPKMIQRKYKKWVCKVCKVPFGSGDHFARHLTYHNGKKEFPCGVCKIKVESEVLLRRHLKAVHKKMGDFHCGKCGESFTTPSGLSKHDKKKHSGGKK